MKKKNKFLNFIFSLVPGCGHMYQGFLKQGFQLLMIFMTVIAVVIILSSFIMGGSLSVLLVFLVPVYCYSFFDSLNKIRENKEPDDSGLVLLDWCCGHTVKFQFKQPQLLKFVGYAFILFGGLSLLNSFGNIVNQIFNYFHMAFPLWLYTSAISSIIFALMLMWGGVTLIKYVKKTLSAADFSDMEDADDLENDEPVISDSMMDGDTFFYGKTDDDENFADNPNNKN